MSRYLADLELAYDSILMFDASIDVAQRAFDHFPFARYPFGYSFGWLFGSGRGQHLPQDFPSIREDLELYIPLKERLVLSGVKLQSPGVWDFVGSLNPLEVLRQYLNDRHERRKDKEYRESAEKRRLLLENLLLENKVISERIRIAKGLGATNRELAPLLNGLVFEPLRSLDKYQDRDAIESAELTELEEPDAIQDP